MITVKIFILITGILIFQCSCENTDSCEAHDAKCFQVAALIPARSGSKGIKDKNLSILGNETLLSRTLRIVNEANEDGIFDSIWVSTDGEKIADEALKHGAKIHWRDPLTATDNASTVSAVENFLLEQKNYNIVAVLQCTSPFLQKNYLIQALDLIKKNDVDCVFSVTRTFQLRWIENKNSFAVPLNLNPKKRQRRQDWEGELVENGMFYISKTKLILQDKVLQNDKCKTIEIPKQYSLEIDTKIDLLLARALLPLLEDYSTFK